MWAHGCCAGERLFHETADRCCPRRRSPLGMSPIIKFMENFLIAPNRYGRDVGFHVQFSSTACAHSFPLIGDRIEICQRNALECRLRAQSATELGIRPRDMELARFFFEMLLAALY